MPLFSFKRLIALVLFAIAFCLAPGACTGQSAAEAAPAPIGGYIAKGWGVLAGMRVTQEILVRVLGRLDL